MSEDAHPLRRVRMDRKVSLSELASALGISKSKLWRVETREQDADLEVIQRTTDYFRPSLTADDYLADRARRAAQ